MKTAMKRLLSFVLVAMMLVSVMPMAVGAEEITEANGDVYEVITHGQSVTGGDEGNISQFAKISDLVAFIRNGNSIDNKFVAGDIEAVPLAGTDTTGETPSVDEDDPPTAGYLYNVTFKKLISKSIAVNVNVEGTEVAADSIDIPAEGSKTVSSILAELQVNHNGMDVAPALGTEITANDGPLTINITERPAPTAVTLRYRPENSNMDSDDEDEFSESGTLYLDNHVVPVFSMGNAVRYNKSVYKVSGWTENPDGSGERLVKGLELDAESPTTYYAQYTKDNVQMNVVRFYAVKFVDDIAQEPELLDYELDVGKDDAVNAVLTNSTANQSLANEMAWRYGDWFDWTAGTYYVNSKCTTPLATTAKVGNGLNIYLKLEYTGTNSVLIYPHEKISDNPRPIQLLGFAMGDVVEKDDVIAAVKKHYSVSSSNVYGLYDQTDWNQIKQLNKTIDGQPSITVDEDSEVIHVLLKNAYTSSSGTASDNPKTGDTILMAVTALGISASALAVLYFLNKKKQSV